LADGEDDKLPNRRELLSQQMDAEQEELEFGPEPDLNIHPGNAERARGEDGKFVAKSDKPEKAEAAPKVAQAPAAEATPKEPAVWERPPKSWKKDYHEVWGTIDPKGREYIVQRENELLGRYSELGPKAKLADTISEVAQPYMNTIRGMGIDITRAVKGLLEADNALRTLPPDQRRAYFLQVGRTYGIDLGGAPAQGQQAAPVDQNSYAINNQINNLRGELIAFKEAQEQAQQASYLAEINSFSQTVEHFEDLRPTMIQLLNAGLATDLKSAYDKALRMNDELFEQAAAAKDAEAQQAQRETANRAAKAAKAAAVSVRGSSPGARPASKAQSRREMLLEQFDGVDSRL